MSRDLTKADIFNAAWPAPVRVEVPALGGHLYVRVLSAAERDGLELEAHRARQGGGGEDAGVNYRGRLVALCACDEQGRRLFVDDDAAEVGRRPGPFVDPVAVAAARANGIGDEAAKALEEARGN